LANNDGFVEAGGFGGGIFGFVLRGKSGLAGIGGGELVLLLLLSLLLLVIDVVVVVILV
jgi:hypothetical protein